MSGRQRFTEKSFISLNASREVSKLICYAGVDGKYDPFGSFEAIERSRAELESRLHQTQPEWGSVTLRLISVEALQESE